MKNKKRIIIGIDPSISHTGIAICDTSGEYIDSETINISRSRTHNQKLLIISAYIKHLVRSMIYSNRFPSCKIYKIICEQPFMGRNSSATAVLWEVVATISQTFYKETGIEMEMISPIAARSKLGISKNASKDDIRRKIESLINKKNLTQDEIDATMIALSQIDNKGVNKREAMRAAE